MFYWTELNWIVAEGGSENSHESTGVSYSDEQLSTLIDNSLDQMDTNRDGCIDFAEYKHAHKTLFAWTNLPYSFGWPRFFRINVYFRQNFVIRKMKWNKSKWRRWWYTFFLALEHKNIFCVFKIRFKATKKDLSQF